VRLEHDSDWADWLIPLTVLVGPEAEEGHGLVAFGSTHGNEYEGPVALKHLVADLSADDARGRVILIPVLNVAAFQAGTREGPGGVNLNRAFVADAGQAPALSDITHRIARFVRDWIWPTVHVVLDLHAGGNVARFAPLASLHRQPEPQLGLSIATARGFGVPFVSLYENLTPGLLTSEAERLGKVTVGCELGWGNSISRDGVRWATRGVLNAGILHDQLHPLPLTPAGEPATIVESIARECTVVAPYRGHFEPVSECGAWVEQGQPIGLLHDFDRIDEPAFQLRAGVSGFLISHAWGAPVRAGQHVALVAQPVDEAAAAL
jgi:N-alpha-acetyl-L-2,4-diaminobutyrate deacetylase